MQFAKKLSLNSKIALLIARDPLYQDGVRALHVAGGYRVVVYLTRRAHTISAYAVLLSERETDDAMHTDSRDERSLQRDMYDQTSPNHQTVRQPASVPIHK
jgi:hypothetical protein